MFCLAVSFMKTIRLADPEGRAKSDSRVDYNEWKGTVEQRGPCRRKVYLLAGKTSEVLARHSIRTSNRNRFKFKNNFKQL